MSKRVLIYQDGLLSYSETFIKKQASALKNWRPILIGHKYIANGLPLENLESQLLIARNASTFQRLTYSVYRWMNKAHPAGIERLQKLDADLIHAHFGTSAVDIWPYAKVLNLPMLVTLHGFDININKEWWESGKRGRRKRHYPQQLLNLARQPQVQFLAVSTAIKNRAIEYGIPAEKISLSYIGVDVADFQTGTTPLSTRKNKIIYVGRLVEKKGASYLIDAFAKVKTHIKDAELLIIGKGKLEKQLKEQIDLLKLEGVIFAGALPNTDVKKHLDSSKIFCLPSITAKSGDAEGLPISILEAQASGVFVVTSSSGGIGDNLIDRETCFVFPEKNSEALAGILIDIFNNQEKYQSIINAEKELINRKFQLQDCTERLEELYDIFSKK